MRKQTLQQQRIGSERRLKKDAKLSVTSVLSSANTAGQNKETAPVMKKFSQSLRTGSLEIMEAALESQTAPPQARIDEQGNVLLNL